MKKQYRIINDIPLVNVTFCLCWLAYFSTYVGRLNYQAAMTQMIADGFVSKSTGGAIATAFFACYGAGQLLSGFLGDKISPFKMIFTGMVVSSFANLLMPWGGSSAMMLFWAVNGLAQSMIWSPILRIFAQVFPPETRMRACININTTVAAGTLFTYLICSWFITVSTWKSSFLFAFVFMLLTAAIWGVFFFWIKRDSFVLVELPPMAERPNAPAAPKAGIVALLIGCGILFLCLPSILNGMLKDSITTWFPTYLIENHNIAPGLSVLLTTLLPLVNLTGAYLGHWLNKLVRYNELKATAMLFAICTGSLALLLTVGRYSMPAAIAFAAISTSCMFGVNTLLISVVPVCFSGRGVVSTVSGILNSATYLGCALSMYLFGRVIESFSWNSAIVIWVALAAMGVLLCMGCSRAWLRIKGGLEPVE